MALRVFHCHEQSIQIDGPELQGNDGGWGNLVKVDDKDAFESSNYTQTHLLIGFEGACPLGSTTVSCLFANHKQAQIKHNRAVSHVIHSWRLVASRAMNMSMHNVT